MGIRKKKVVKVAVTQGLASTRFKLPVVTVLTAVLRKTLAHEFGWPFF